MLTIDPIPAFEDNYIWCLRRGDEAWVVDPGDAAPVQAHLAASGLKLAGILITHHHGDHTGGIRELTVGRPGLPVYGPAVSDITGLTRPLEDGDDVEVLGIRFEVLAVPGHTLDHIAYFWPGDGSRAPLLFCGDTLFAAGCGRVFEGTPAQMFASLERLAALPAATAVYCAHEYTLSNLRFAAAVEPASAELARRTEEATARRTRGEPTLPSTLALELATNPFLRCREPAVQAAARQRGEAASPAEIFAVLRAWKDKF